MSSTFPTAQTSFVIETVALMGYILLACQRYLLTVRSCCCISFGSKRLPIAAVAAVGFVC